MPAVSVVIPTYNRADVLPRAIDSALSQTVADIEVIVVDDGSTDDTEDVVADYDDSRLQYVKQGNRGANAARNLGIREAEGTYVSFLDSDDAFEPEYLEVCMETLEDASDQVAGVYTAYEVYRNGDFRTVSEARAGKTTLDALARRNVIGGFSCVTVRRDVFEDIGYLDEALPARQDYDFFLRVLQRYDLVGIDRPLVTCYHGDDSITASPQRRITAQERILEKHADVLSPKVAANHHYSLGFIYMERGERDRSVRAFRAAIDHDRHNPLYYLHYVTARLGKPVFDATVTLKTWTKACLYRAKSALR